jgi:hypothetical protein
LIVPQIYDIYLTAPAGFRFPSSGVSSGAIQLAISSQIGVAGMQSLNNPCIGFCQNSVSFSSYLLSYPVDIEISTSYNSPAIQSFVFPVGFQFTLALPDFSLQNTILVSILSTSNPATALTPDKIKWFTKQNLLVITIPFQISALDVFNISISGFAYKSLSGTGITLYAGNQNCTDPLVAQGIVTNNNLKITSISSGAVTVGQFISGPNIQIGTAISTQLSANEFFLTEGAIKAGSTNVTSLGVMNTKIPYPVVYDVMNFSIAELEFYSLSAISAESVVNVSFTFKTRKVFFQQNYIDIKFIGCEDMGISLLSSSPMKESDVNVIEIRGTTLPLDPTVRISFSSYISEGQTSIIHFSGLKLPITGVYSGI